MHQGSCHIDGDHMDYEGLMKSLEGSAEEKKAAIIEKARREAASIQEEARAQSGEIVKARLSRAAAVAELERNKSLYEARSEVKKNISMVKHQLFLKAFKDAEKRLDGVRSLEDYELSYRKMLEEALAALGDKQAVLHVDRRDEALAKKILSSIGRSIEVKPGQDTIGGLYASTPDGKVVVYNTIESRLRMARERLKMEVFSTLFGD